MRAVVCRKLLVATLCALLALLAVVSLAYAYDERYPAPSGHAGLDENDCLTCHPAGADSCGPCHFGDWTYGGKGPHGLYLTTTRRCASCHEAHDAGGAKLLPAATVAASCATCHDATGGEGVYGTIASRGLTPGARHRVDSTRTVPGGDAATGGSKDTTFSGLGGTLGCDDCHSPHDANTVTAFDHERRRTIHDYMANMGIKTTRLLRRNPGGSVTTATAYGSDWCVACHAGRVSGGAIHNHPAESRATTSSPFTYGNVAVLSSDNLTTSTVMGTMASTNRGYLMPSPRTPQQGAHLPICQQCHEDSRNVGSLNATGTAGDAATYQVGSIATTLSSPGDNPRFQNFPHETVNARMTVEAGDDLCLNCHPPTALP